MDAIASETIRDAADVIRELRSQLAFYEKDYPRLRAENWMLRTVIGADMLGEDREYAERIIPRRWLLTEMSVVRVKIDNEHEETVAIIARDDEADGTPPSDQFPLVKPRG